MKMRRWRSALTACVLVCAGCPESSRRGVDATPQSTASTSFEAAESIYEGALKNGWQESGTVQREQGPEGVAKVRFNISWEWILSRPGLDGHYGAIAFRIQEPPGEGEFLEVRIVPKDGRKFRAVKIKPDHRIEVGGGWTQVVVPMSELNPDGAAFDRVIFSPFRPFGSEWVLFDKIVLAKATVSLPASMAASGKPVKTRIACDSKATKISPFIYGIAFGDAGWDKLGATARRWGGNPKSRYNWETNCDNRASDWFFENAASTPYTQFLSESVAHGVESALTVPTIGWVAKDDASYSFPVTVFGPQSKIDPWKTDAGNGLSPGGQLITPGLPTRTSVPASPDWAKRWVSAIVAADAKGGTHSVHEYILDNEPALWSATHRDVHPDPVGYDELLERTIQYGAAIREADPSAIIAGPAEWGWTGYLYSAKDIVMGHADRRAHGDMPLVEWYLRKLREYERQTGTRPLDVLDLHYYPQESNVYNGGGGGTDRETQLLRLNSTRSLWDETYVDESWIKEVVRLLPRMREWVDRDYPGRGISIGEWNFGGERDITGALATAEALGRFAQFGVASAFYWMAPPTGSASSFGFLAYRNFDGKGGHFLDWYVPTTASSGASFFASRDEGGKHLVVVAINMLPDTQLLADFDLGSCGPIASYQSYVYRREANGFALTPAAVGAAAPTLQRALPPWSITVLDLHIGESPGAK